MNTLFDEFSYFCQSAEAGEQFTYHVGYLPTDREPTGRGRYEDHFSDERKKVEQAAVFAYSMGKRRVVDLVQKRLGDMNYQYIAVKKYVQRHPVI